MVLLSSVQCANSVDEGGKQEDLRTIDEGEALVGCPSDRSTYQWAGDSAH